MSEKSMEEIKKILLQELSTILSVQPSKIGADVPLHTLGMDSLGFVELLVLIEKKFDVKLMESGLKRDDFKTISSLASAIKNK